MTASRILDADGHILEDIPAIRKRFMHLNNGPTGGGATYPSLDHLHLPRGTMREGSFAPGVDARAWVRFMDEVGIESTVIYPTSGLGFARVINSDWAVALAAAYNDWLYDTYTSRDSRIRGVGLLALHEPEAAAAELRRMVTQLGFVGGCIPSHGWQQHLGVKAYWPVYAEAERLGCMLGVHGGNHGQMGMDHVNHWWMAHAIGHPHGQTIALAVMVGNGIFDRFPKLRVAYLEAGVGWVFNALERFSGSYGAFTPDNPNGEYLRLKPHQTVGDYIAEKMRGGNIFVGCEGDEPTLGYACRSIGPEPWVYSSDFPHEVNAASCRHEIDELLENDDVTEAHKQAILATNVERLYTLTPSAAAAPDNRVRIPA